MKHVPQIWGVQFPKILGIIVGAGLLIGVGQVIASSTVGKIIAFIVGAAGACAGYAVCLMREKQAELANKDDWPHMRATLTSQCGSESFVRILRQRQKNGVDGKNRKTTQRKKPSITKKERAKK